jgi:hypothetical protein
MNWIPIIATLLGGGAMGALITLIATRFRNRRQPVVYKTEVIDIFKKISETQSFRAFLSRDNDELGVGDAIGVDNYSVARITLINKGNQDLAEFKFGITLKGTGEAIDVKTESPDRHHILTLLTPVDLLEPLKELDFIAQPFNRGEPYIVNVYFTYAETANEVQLSSPHSTRFIEAGSVDEISIKTILDSSTMRQLFFWTAILIGALILYTFVTIYKFEFLPRFEPSLGTPDRNFQQIPFPTRQPSPTPTQGPTP